MKRLGTPFGAALLALLVLAGWALWSGGVLDGEVARQVRVSSVYAAPGYELDQAAAERIVGNRRLVVAFLEPDADLREACHGVRGAADGTLALMLKPGEDEFDRYSCALLPGVDDENFGKAVVAETTLGAGVDQFVDQPLEALKVVAVNYDQLVKAGIVPDGARVISPSLPRFLVAAAAVGAVVAGAVLLYAGARRAGRLASVRRRRRTEVADDRAVLTAAATALAQRIIDLDAAYARTSADTHTARERAEFGEAYRALVADYVALLPAITEGEPDVLRRVEDLVARTHRLSAHPAG
ncbi:hypothetical protein [Actinosynnema sp. NPDC020468]|uniref:hypothetical protein n=1 Tax=Actinosynnema sp. NPDC020468 TaxID=3154488 RepID=UPI0033C55938